ncbi:MAG: proprotein convertase P-domain-containing protein [Myxococcales bacterium]|nr:proprotein convertase P-domain-containing protein [Myxococcales bacterium]
MRKLLISSSTLLLLLAGCPGGDDDDDEPPPPPTTATAPDQPAAPPGQVMVTVAANSTPPGATVVGGGRNLGVTPLQTQVPIPAPQPGQPAQTFAFTFTLEGYQPATINASPVNNTISITAALAPAIAAQPVGGDPAAGGDDADPGRSDGPSITVRGRGGGPIYDYNTTTGTATVTQSCIIDSLQLQLAGTHSYFGDLHITLRDPEGHSYSIARGGRANPFRTHRVRRASGRQARGTWRLAIEDRLRQDSGILRSWSMTMTCR